jgi:putative tryptophan/tyrosine transport system substrate-binding protein
VRRREFIGLVGGAVTAWPLAARAQQPKPAMATLGLLGPVDIAGASPVFLEALGRLGYQQGRNLTIHFRYARDSNAELTGLAAELVNLRPDVLGALGTPPVLALKGATSAILIVMLAIGDPIATGSRSSRAGHSA